jgi:Golgi phosphoprotein 3 (GPP34)
MTSVALADELLMLAYDDETGRCCVPGIALDLGMAAAILIDLILHGRIEVADRVIVPLDPDPTGHETDDEVLHRIVAEKPQPVAFWLQRLRHNLRHRVLDRLIAEGVMRDQDVTAWDVLRVHRYPMIDSRAEEAARGRLAAALAGDGVPDERTAALAALVAATRMESTLGLTGEAVANAHRQLEKIAAAAGFAAGTGMEQSTVRPSVAFLVGELDHAVRAALGPAKP